MKAMLGNLMKHVGVAAAGFAAGAVVMGSIATVAKLGAGLLVPFAMKAFGTVVSGRRNFHPEQRPFLQLL